MDAEREDFACRPDATASSDDVTDSRRRERLAKIRAMIEDGTYETAERLEAAVSRFLSAVAERT